VGQGSPPLECFAAEPEGPPEQLEPQAAEPAQRRLEKPQDWPLGPLWQAGESRLVAGDVAAGRTASSLLHTQFPQSSVERFGPLPVGFEQARPLSPSRLSSDYLVLVHQR
ncbi:MAG: hypothetical protein L0312_23025, partial [Acidobacteria bacterium]|nr:hypothetical protein [Acidobacteriota bacterium]